jgi:8-oxo-dGTP pyrophosphatase MutT (NUDIX family)
MTLRNKVVCVLISERGYLFTRRRDPVKRLVFLIPVGGGMEGRESPLSAVRREVREELGLELADVTCLGVLTNEFEWKGQPRRETIYCYQARVDGAAVPPAARESNGQLLPLEWHTLAGLWQEERPVFPEGLLQLLAMAPPDPS